MSRSSPHDEMKEMAALYALGALTREEALVFDFHLSDGCEDCRSELDSFEPVVTSLGMSIKPIAPPAALKDKLMWSLTKGRAKSQEGFSSVYSNEGEWKEAARGIHIKLLSLDETTGYATSLVRMAAGTHLPGHAHSGVEQFFVIEGDCRVHDDVLGPGDFHRAEAGSIHEATSTEGGTLLLLIARPDYQWLDD